MLLQKLIKLYIIDSLVLILQNVNDINSPFSFKLDSGELDGASYEIVKKTKKNIKKTHSERGGVHRQNLKSDAIN